MKRLTLAFSALALLAPVTAEAATVSVGAVTEGSDGPAQEARFVAASGEANRLSVRATLPGLAEPLLVTFTDPGATITAGAGCTASSDGRSATCAYEAGVPFKTVRVELGDGDDTLTHVPGAFDRALIGSGGPGDDTLSGGSADDRLDGGGGTDTISGGGGVDFLTDGDSDANADADVLDGGGPAADPVLTNDTADVVSYARRTKDLTIDLDGTSAADGVRGERDTLLDLESVTGGAGDDVIRARTGSYGIDLRGGAGDDLLDARGTVSGLLYSQRLEGGPGRDTLIGSATGNTDYLGGRGFDRYRCNDDEGIDLVNGAGAREVLARPCDNVVFRPDTSGSVFFRKPAGRLVGRRSVRHRVVCGRPREDDRGTVELRERGGRHRLLGRGSFICGFGDSSVPFVTRLTLLGARLTRRRAGVLVTIRVELEDLGRASWSYRLSRTS